MQFEPVPPTQLTRLVGEGEVWYAEANEVELLEILVLVMLPSVEEKQGIFARGCTREEDKAKKPHPLQKEAVKKPSEFQSCKMRRLP